MKSRYRPALYVFMVLAAAYLLAPVGWMVLLSVTNQAEALSVPPHWTPENPTVDNYKAFFQPNASQALIGADAIAAMPRAILNSVVVGVSVAVVNVVIGSMAAYSFARLKFRGSGTLMVVYLASRMVPAIGIMIPLYVVMQNLGLLNNLVSLVLVETAETLPFSIWLLASYFRTIPRDIEDAARIDRCSWLRAMVKVFLPVAAPCLVATAVFGFMSSWGSFLYPLLFTSGPESATLPVIVSNFATDLNADYGLLSTSGVFAILPPFLLALWFQRWIVSGVASGAVKG
ncbi:carbohydrate ABC transporter membrane protein 2, CUT1 family [Micromonospora rhizosphaerae]|uniref:Carbohydrate ABC transporter membrane protein 2, CUT1 family n=1 Tax=Micromonospora rhizosphaerae TaxID=568872 RepID=A0A1C6T377_9ACTN|nr:carbohydrate ABC transporter permease [Micromonospora rhizosphaerae]SCL36218.1 carbohydrate ABC transporter membrane protein 2, CUT1 family [Micromonospora rhizosphaerae]